MPKDTELPPGNLLFSIVLNAIGVRIVKHGDAHPTLRTRSRRRGCCGSCGSCSCCCSRCCCAGCCSRRCGSCRCCCSCCRSCRRGRRGCASYLEIIGLAAIVGEVAISSNPHFVFSTWVRRVIVPGSGEATRTCLKD